MPMPPEYLADLRGFDHARVAREVMERGERVPADVALRVPKLPDLPAVCRSLPGMFKRLPTGLAKLDEITRGGLQTRRFVVLAGAPGGYKTTLALAIGYDMARNGASTPAGHVPVYVAVVADDESRIGLMSRIGQREGVSRDALESEDLSVSGPAWEQVATALEQIPTFTIIDSSVETEPSTVEQTIALVAAEAKARGARLLVIADSLQKARCATDEIGGPADSVRAKIDRRLEMLKRAAHEHECCVLVTCELNRPGYSGDTEPEMSHLKESGGIEYTADLVLGMHRPDRDDRFVVQVRALKNRISADHDGVRFRLRRTERCAFETADMPPETTPEDRARRNEEAVSAAAEELVPEVVRVVVESQGRITSRTDLLARLRGRQGRSQAVISAAVSLAITSGAIAKHKGTFVRGSIQT